MINGVELSKLTVKILRKNLKQKGCLEHYRTKADLVERLSQVLEEEAKTDKTNEISPENKENCGKLNQFQFPLQQKLKREKMTEKEAEIQNNFLLKDVEEALEQFNGDSGKKIEKWLEDFESISTLCKWNNIQKFLYARRLLKGAAKLAIESELGVSNWEKLKEILIKEFGGKEDDNVHKILENTKKSSKESHLEYLYKMKSIANKGIVGKSELIEYIIHGIPDDPLNKVCLYGAKDLSELKEKLIGYEKMKNEQNKEKRSKPSEFPFKIQKRDDYKQQRCANCGAFSHNSGNCPNKPKGTRCFRCNEFGHIAKNCQIQKSEKYHKINPQVNRLILPNLSIPVQIKGKTFSCLIDTGSDITIIRQTVKDSIGKANYEGPGTFVLGFGENKKNPWYNLHPNSYKFRKLRRSLPCCSRYLVNRRHNGWKGFLTKYNTFNRKW